jgi:oxygen-independent coproporphyrinogen-3 oxidase
MHKPHEPISLTSNPQLACMHNLQYWHNLPYLGFGAGAHGYANGIRTANVLSPKAYIQRLHHPTDSSDNLHALLYPCTPATTNAQPIDKKAEIGETLMMGLRLTREGVSEETFQERFHQSLLETFRPEIARLEKLKLLEWVQSEKSHLRLTPNGRLLGNQVFLEFI